jgi:hypothetical protein
MVAEENNYVNDAFLHIKKKLNDRVDKFSRDDKSENIF